MNTKNEVIRAAGLSRHFGKRVAVDGIDFHVRQGECFGFLGPNGAGKTTTVQMTYGFTTLTGGRLQVLGFQLPVQAREVKARIGVCPQDNNLDEEFTVERNLVVYARYFDISRRVALTRCRELLEFVGLQGHARDRLSTLSGGMRRRLVLARALINRPRVLILDEPTTGLDPQARHQVWRRLRSLKQLGTTILLTSHYMEEASQLCDRLMIMDRGRILTEGTPAALIREHVGRDVVEVGRAADHMAPVLAAAGLDAERAGDRFYIRAGSDGGPSGEAIHALIARRFPGHPLVLRPAHLEDVFLRLTGRELRP